MISMISKINYLSIETRKLNKISILIMIKFKWINKIIYQIQYQISSKLSYRRTKSRLKQKIIPQMTSLKIV